MINRVEFQHTWTDRDGWAEALVRAGLGREAAKPKSGLLHKAASEVLARHTDSSAAQLTAFFVPGRIEVLGKHTDYAGGRTIVATLERGFCVVVAPRNDRLIRVTAVVGDNTAEFPLSPDLVPITGDWSNYPMTAARRIAKNFPDACRGAEIAFGSDLPKAAGMSSSSVMIVAMFLAMAEVNGLWTRPKMRDNVTNLVELAGYLATVENGQTFRQLEGDRGVGTFGGSEDHTAVLGCQRNTLSEYSYCPVEFQRHISVPDGYCFAIGSTGVVAEKTGTAMEKYNRASRLARIVSELWCRETGRDEPHLAAILESSPDAADRLRQIIETATLGDDSITRDDLLTRFEHFRQENCEFLPAAGDALARGDLKGFGCQVDQSQRAAEQLLGNQVPETSFLAASARENGAAAASAFGAGFGGSVWAMIQTDRTSSFLESWSAAYKSQFPEHAANCQFFTTAAAPAAFQLSPSL